MALAWQPSLLGGSSPRFDPTFARASRRDLGSGAWLDLVAQWVEGADELFEQVLADAPWGEHQRWMYDRKVLEPRLTTKAWPDPPALIEEMAVALTERYDQDMSVISANLYRDGRDSVAWHGDRIGRRREQTVVAILSLGEARRFLLRPVTGGPSVRLLPQPGDLMVLGGSIQRTWQHTVPKVARAGPRISVMFREGY